MTVDVLLPVAFADLLQPARYKVYFGGRGSAKSWSFATVLVMRATSKPLRILCTRELQNSIDDSVHRLLADTITRLGLDDRFDVFRDEIRCRNGSLFIFESLRFNVKRIKSLEGVDLCWVEEADALSNESWNLLIPTIRKAGSEIWISFNRDREDDPAYVRFVEKAPKAAIVRKVTWRDNPWFPPVLRQEIERDMATDPELHAHIWEGEPWGRSDAQVFRGKYTVREFDTPVDATFYLGADFGFAHDPDTVVRCFIQDEVLYVDAEGYGHGVEIGETAAFFDSVLPHKRWPVRADSARPELISYLNGQGYNVIAAHKGPGSVEDGIRYLLSFKEIIVHPRCRHLAEELRLYSYKTDPRTGDVLPILIGKHDHCIDALRYGVEEIYQQDTGRIAPYSAASLGL